MADTGQPERRSWRPCVAALALPVCLLILTGMWVWAARGTAWWAQALRSELFIRCGVLLMGCAVALQLVLTAMVRLGRRGRRFSVSDERGVAVVEFTLVFPIAMGIVLVMVQTALVMVGNLLVHYAAYSAARSAVVEIPTHTWQEIRNELGPDGASDKRLRIRRAAVLALLPAAGSPGRSNPASSESDKLGAAMATISAAYDEPVPGWVGEKLARKYAYADDDRNTRIELEPPAFPEDHDGNYGPREDIRVIVTHRLYLPVPYACRIFADGELDSGGHYYTEVTASYVLVNQGRPDNVRIEWVRNNSSEEYDPPSGGPVEVPGETLLPR